MKGFFAIILTFISLSVFCQDLWKNEVDEFTGSVNKITESYVVANGVGNLSIQVGRVDNTHFMFVYSSADLGCSGASNNSIIFKFTDGTTLKLEDVADINCGDTPVSTFIFRARDFENKTVDKIRFQQSNYYDDCIWSDKWCNFTFSQLLLAIK